MSTHGQGITTIDDMRSRCVIDDITHCWRWGGAFNSSHGSRCPIAYNPITRRVVTATRLSLILTGKQPGAVTWRKCGCDACVNPAHLLTGSRADWGQWCERQGTLRGHPERRAASRRAKMTSGAKITPELAAWARESGQEGVDVAHALGISTTSVSRVRLGRTWAPFASPFAGLGAILTLQRPRPGPAARARAANGPIREAA